MNIGNRVKDLRPVWEDVDAVLRKSASSVFKSEGREPNKWLALADATARQRASLGYGAHHPILVRSGVLKKSTTDRQHRHHIFVSKPLHFETGTTVDYAVYHQSPAKRKKARSGPRAGQDRLPRRAFYYIDKKEVARIIGLIRGHALKEA